MNRRITLALVVAIATILPAVAVADVMITGTFDLEAGTNSNVYFFQPGSNYKTAHDAGLITWTDPSSSLTQGTVDLQGIQNQTSYMVNVLDLNFSTSPTAIPPPFVMYLNVTDSSFPSGVVMVVSTSPLTLHDLKTITVQTYSGTSITVNGADSGAMAAVDLSENPSLVLTNFTGDSTFYFAFIIPQGGLVGHSATLVGSFVAT